VRELEGREDPIARVPEEPELTSKLEGGRRGVEVGKSPELVPPAGIPIKDGLEGNEDPMAGLSPGEEVPVASIGLLLEATNPLLGIPALTRRGFDTGREGELPPRLLPASRGAGVPSREEEVESEP
jgi:hypothetical protein